MSGRDEMPTTNLICPECRRQGITNTHWSLLVGSHDHGNWGRYNLEDEYLDNKYLHRHVGENITRVKCYHKDNVMATRHTFTNIHITYWNVINAVGFDEGVVK